MYILLSIYIYLCTHNIHIYIYTISLDIVLPVFHNLGMLWKFFAEEHGVRFATQLHLDLDQEDINSFGHFFFN